MLQFSNSQQSGPQRGVCPSDRSKECGDGLHRHRLGAPSHREVPRGGSAGSEGLGAEGLGWDRATACQLESYCFQGQRHQPSQAQWDPACTRELIQVDLQMNRVETKHLQRIIRDSQDPGPVAEVVT